MRISRNWLQHFFNAPLPDASVLADALTFHAFEIESIEKTKSDEILDVNITPNRGHDCLSHRGIAKEISAILSIPLTHDPYTDESSLAPTIDNISITIEDPAFCRRYVAGYIQNVRVGPSPEWLKKNLETLGERSINNVVDATNFVMFNIGQPLHAFDAEKLPSLALGVREAREGEVIEALDHKMYTLSPSMHVITAADEPIAIAGIKGGLPCAVNESTTNIVIEAANFAGPRVRSTARALKFRTDASTRFEQEISPELASLGMRSVVALIQKIAGGEIVGFRDVYLTPQEPHSVKVTLDKINKVLGTDVRSTEVKDVFTRLGIIYEENDGEFCSTPPLERLDLKIPEDFIEEIARIIGYEKIKGEALPPTQKPVEINPQFFASERVREELQALGYSEVYTSVFSEAGERAVLNKVDSVKPYLRTSLIPGLEAALKKNIPNKDLLGLSEVKLFEIGFVWKDDKEVLMLGRIGEKEKPSETPLEELAAEQYEVFPVSTTSQFEPFSKFPYIVRDIALWTPASTNTEEVRAMLWDHAGPLCVKISLFDTFKKGDKTSLAFRLIFQSFERTLTEAEVNDQMQKVSDTVKVKGFEVR